MLTPNHHTRAIIYDLGNVVFDCSFDPTYQYWADLRGQSVQSLVTKLDIEMESNLFEKGAITPDEFRIAVSHCIGYELSTHEFETGWNAIYGEVRKGIYQLLLQVKQNYQVIALTNTNATHAKVWKKKYENTLSIFEKVYSSHEIGYRKPEPEAFELCLTYLNLKAEEVLFLDDNAANIESANQLGLQTIQVSTFNQMVADMQKLGIII